MRTLTIEILQDNVYKVQEICNLARQVRIGSSATSIAGGIVAIVGLALIPVTVGGSVVISATGGLVALAGGVGSFGSTVVEKRSSHMKLKKAQECIDLDQQLCQLIAELHQNLKHLAENTPNHGGVPSGTSDIAKSSVNVSKVVQSGALIAKGAVAASMEVGRTGGALAVQGGIFAARLGSTAVRSLAGIGGAISLMILPWDVYELTTNAIKYHNQSESSATKWLNEQLHMLRLKREEAEREYHQGDVIDTADQITTSV